MASVESDAAVRLPLGVNQQPAGFQCVFITGSDWPGATVHDIDGEPSTTQSRIRRRGAEETATEPFRNMTN